ncbi:MAG: type II toxin-antitoxin system HicA family toxin, partial [Bacteroidales bacterium]|nr:type II toxin-antitoxin system HicA family toxin [Bacteroidales bacterium]
NGWAVLPKKGKGSHIRYTQNGVIYTVPYHGSKEMDNVFVKKILKEMGIEQ